MPSITGQFLELTQQDFDALAPDGQPLHFRDRFIDGILQNGINPLDGSDAGKPERGMIQDLADLHGWPLPGLFVGQVGGTVNKHYIHHRLDFPSQSGNPNDRAGKLTDEMSAAMQRVFQISTDVTDPEDEDFGETDIHDPFFANIHFWNYLSSGVYEPKIAGGGGDYIVQIRSRSIGNAPGNPPWWQRFN